LLTAPICTVRIASGILPARPERTHRVGEHGITELLQQHREGDPAALNRVFDALYRDLRGVAAQRLARLPPGGTLTPTALVHEAWMRLAGAQSLDLHDRGHFFACAARAMRHVLLDAARARGAEKRGGGALPVTLTSNVAADAAPLEMLDLERVLVELEAIDPQLGELVELRFFSGMSVEDIAQLRGVSDRTVFRQWQQARAFLQVQLGES
jgi:RNA polymerase sigma factor (TIGR02999 family)